MALVRRQRVRIARLSPLINGKILARTIPAPDGRPLLVAGSVLTPSYIKRLHDKGYRFVYIEDEFSLDIQPDDVLDELTRARALTTLQESLENIAGKRPLDSGKVSGVVEDIIKNINSTKGIAFSLSTIRSLDEYTFIHSLNVCVLALVIGAEARLPLHELMDLGVGALLHDVGKVIIPLDILNKPDGLTREEMSLVKLHTLEGFEILKSQPGISLLSSHVAFQHHEKIDGTGYPRGIEGPEIHRYARMTAVADIMDAISARRPYRNQLAPDRACSLLLSLSGPHLDAAFVDMLIRKIALFPAGSVVRLSTGQIGIVSRQSRSDPSRPIVHVLTDDRSLLINPFELELDMNPQVLVSEILPDFPGPVIQQISKIVNQ